MDNLIRGEGIIRGFNHKLYDPKTGKRGGRGFIHPVSCGDERCGERHAVAVVSLQAIIFAENLKKAPFNGRHIEFNAYPAREGRLPVVKNLAFAKESKLIPTGARYGK